MQKFRICSQNLITDTMLIELKIKTRVNSSNGNIAIKW
jgi:hypothetical protein